MAKDFIIVYLSQKQDLKTINTNISAYQEKLLSQPATFSEQTLDDH